MLCRCYGQSVLPGKWTQPSVRNYTLSFRTLVGFLPRPSAVTKKYFFGACPHLFPQEGGKKTRCFGHRDRISLQVNALFDIHRPCARQPTKKLVFLGPHKPDRLSSRHIRPYTRKCADRNAAVPRRGDTGSKNWSNYCPKA